MVGRERAGAVRVGLDLQRHMPYAVVRLQFLRQVAQEASPGKPPGMTRCAVSAISVVLIGQMWRSWTG